MSDTSTICAIRFGTGLSPRHAPPEGAQALMASLEAPDTAATAFPIQSFDQRRETGHAYDTMRRQMKADRSDTQIRTQLKAAGKAMDAATRTDALNYLARGIHSPDTLRERLVWFWADHFTVRSHSRALRGAVTNYVEAAIRPHVTGRFRDMLKAVVTHPLMLEYLDQSQSVGPNSKVGLKKDRGVNENLAREMLELHTLGIGGPYSQSDVQQMALLLTGLYSNTKAGFAYRRNAAEPGAKRLLGKSYGGKTPRLADVHAALDDIALMPATARHLSRKMAVHFLADDLADDLAEGPAAGMIDAMAAAYLAGDGDLKAMVAAMLDHPAAWQPLGAKAKRPLDFVVSAFRALDLPEGMLHRMKRKDLQRRVFGPMAVMGQPFQQPPAPNGWPETAEAWITPQAMAARIQWSMVVPAEIYRALPDPRDFVRTTLADAADGRLTFAASAAETRWEGIGLVLASPAFNRR